MLRISVSDLESLRWWRDSEGSTMEQLVARLTHAEPPTPAMEAGRAFARVMETAAVGEVDVVTMDDWTFDFSGLDHAIGLPDVRELKAEVVFQTPHGPVTLVGKVDGINGRTVHDQKLSERLDAEKYLDSLQWRAYLVMFDATKFVYDVFVGRYDRGGDRLVQLTDYQSLPFYTYPGIRQDVQAAVNELARVIVTYVPSLVTAEARAA
jgi:hypothetical protein